MIQKKARKISIFMLIAAILFISYALTHPTASFSLPIGLTYAIYLIYLIVMCGFFIVSFQKDYD